MELTENQIERIYSDIHKKGVTMNELADSLVDHICCAIEREKEMSFEEAYQQALAAFGDDGLQRTQRETILFINQKKEIIMKKTMFILGYIAVSLITTGLLFKLQHWPGASIMLVFGIGLLNFGFLPMYFYGRYKQAIS
ncbi:GldL-related protein [Halocola ammonii]